MNNRPVGRSIDQSIDRFSLSDADAYALIDSLLMNESNDEREHQIEAHRNGSFGYHLI